MSMTTDEVVAWMLEMAERRVPFRLEYNINYGANNRIGWSVSIYGHIVVEFAPTFTEAIAEAKRKYAEVLADE